MFNHLGVSCSRRLEGIYLGQGQMTQDARRVIANICSDVKHHGGINTLASLAHNFRYHPHFSATLNKPASAVVHGENRHGMQPAPGTLEARVFDEWSEENLLQEAG